MTKIRTHIRNVSDLIIKILFYWSQNMDFQMFLASIKIQHIYFGTTGYTHCIQRDQVDYLLPLSLFL